MLNASLVKQEGVFVFCPHFLAGGKSVKMEGGGPHGKSCVGATTTGEEILRRQLKIDIDNLENQVEMMKREGKKCNYEGL